MAFQGNLKLKKKKDSNLHMEVYKAMNNKYSAEKDQKE